MTLSKDQIAQEFTNYCKEKNIKLSINNKNLNKAEYFDETLCKGLRDYINKKHNVKLSEFGDIQFVVAESLSNRFQMPFSVFMDDGYNEIGYDKNLSYIQNKEDKDFLRLLCEQEKLNISADQLELIQTFKKVKLYINLKDALSDPNYWNKDNISKKAEYQNEFDRLKSDLQLKFNLNNFASNFTEIIGNRDFNNAVGKILRVDSYFSTYYENSLSDLKYFSYKLSNLKDEKNIDDLFAKLKNGEKITPYEFNILESLNSVAYIFKLSPEISNNVIFNKLKLLAEEGNKFINKVRSQMHSMNLNGFLFNSFDKKEKFNNKKTKDIEEKLTKKHISKYSHSGAIYSKKNETTKKNENFLNDVVDIYYNTRLAVKDVLISDLYNLKASRLVNTNAILDSSKVSEIKEYADKQAIELFKKLSNKKFAMQTKNGKLIGGIKNSQKKRFLAGLADFGILGFHKGFRKYDAKRYANIFFGNDESLNHHQFCSEFNAKQIVAIVEKLNQDIRQKYNLPEDAEIIKQPFGKHEDLTRIHPERLYNLLSKAGCITRQVLPEEISSRFKNAEEEIPFNKLNQQKIDKLFTRAVKENDEIIWDQIEARINNKSLKISPKAIYEAVSFCHEHGETEMLGKVSKLYNEPKIAAKLVEMAIEKKDIKILTAITFDKKDANYAKDMQNLKNKIIKKFDLKTLSKLQKEMNADMKANNATIQKSNDVVKFIFEMASVEEAKKEKATKKSNDKVKGKHTSRLKSSKKSVLKR